MKDNKHMKHGHHGVDEKEHTSKQARSDSKEHERKEDMNEDKRPQSKRGGRHCPNC